MKRIFRKELLIGVVTLAALAILFFGIDFLKGVNVFKAANYYYAVYNNVQGLAQSAPVTVNGYKVGLVREISYQYDNPGHVLVELSLDKSLKLPRGSRAVITTDMLGTSTIALDMASGSDYYSVGDTIAAANSAGLMDNVTSMLPSVEAIFPKIDTLLTSLNNVVADPALLLAVQRLDAITANLQQMTARLAAVSSTLNPVVADVKQITGNVSTMTGDLTAVSARLREAPLDSIISDIDALTGNLRALSNELQSPNSTMGKLMHDPALYNNLNNTIQSLDSLFIDIKKNPKRYISIKLL